VCNHLSYLDIVVLAASTPCVFVAKKEVRSWPVFGVCAQLAGSLFVNRERRGEVEAVAGEMEKVLAEGLLLVLFPEGTSSDGSSVLPFKTPLFEPVAQLRSPVAAVAISYQLVGGSVPEEICYWGDMTLAPHLLNVFSKPRIEAIVRFGPACERAGDRKAIARELYDEVAQLHSGEPGAQAWQKWRRESPRAPLVTTSAR
jgi:1-acyl-sn-glycerol-3-phosphate acyltransferase